MPTQSGLCGFTPLPCIKWEYFSFAMEVSQLAGCAVCMDSYMMVAMAALVTPKGRSSNLLNPLSVTDWYMPPGPTGGTSARAADPGS